MNADNDFLRSEQRNLETTLRLIEGLTARDNLSEYEVIAMGKLLQDVYMGIERILRYLLENRGVKTEKSPSWHKDILSKARDENLISLAQFNAFTNLLLFRHLQIHGYGFNLNETRLKELAAPVPDLCINFFKNIQQ
jgi:hypothetical protein